MADSPSDKRLPFMLGLVAGLISMALIVASAAGLAMYVGWYAVVASFLVVPPAVFALGFVRHSGAVMAASIFGLSAAAIGAMSLADYATATRGVVLRDIAVEEVVRYPEATAFHFRDAAVRVECEGSFLGKDASGGTGTWHYAAPVVNAHGPSDARVAAWAVCPDWGNCRKLWRQPFSAAVRKGMFTEDFASAAARAAEKCGLQALEGAALVEWVESPEASIAQLLADFWEAVRFFAIGWLAVVLVAKVAWSLRRRRTTTPADSAPIVP